MVGDILDDAVDPIYITSTVRTVYVSRHGESVLPSAIETIKTKGKHKKTKTMTLAGKTITIAVTDETTESTTSFTPSIKREITFQKRKDDSDEDDGNDDKNTKITTSTVIKTIKSTSIETSTAVPTSIPWGSDPNEVWGGSYPPPPPPNWGSENGTGMPPPPPPPPIWVTMNGTAVPFLPPPPSYGTSGYPMPASFAPGPTAVATATQTQYLTRSWSYSGTPTAISAEGTSENSTGAIVGGVVGGVGGAALIAGTLFFFLRRKKRRNALPSNDSDMMFETNPSHHWDSYRCDLAGTGARAFVPPAINLPDHESYIPDSPKPTAYYQSPLHTGTTASAYSPEVESDYFDSRYHDGSTNPGYYTNEYYVPRYADPNCSETTMLPSAGGATGSGADAATRDTDEATDSDKTLLSGLKPDTREGYR